MKQSLPTVATLLVFGLMWGAVSAGDVDPISRAKGPDKSAKKAGKPKKDFPEFTEVVTDDFRTIQIFSEPDKTPYYTLYHNTKTDHLLAQIPQSKLNRDFMISTTLAGGNAYAGWQWQEIVARWERRDKKLLLVGPDIRNYIDDDNKVRSSVKRTYTDRVIKTIQIKTVKGGDPVIDLGDLFKNDLSNVGKVFGGALDVGLAKWTKFKCFENNIVLTVESPFRGSSWADMSDGALMSVNYNVSYMPDTGYKPRAADDRIGYFMTVRRDWGKDYKARTLFNRYVNRWQLEKQDPSLDMSPVKNPIVFYVEKTVPVRFRSAVKEGIEEWNKAFEKCGFVDAIQARQQTATNEFSKYDPEDVTKNFFRWSTANNGLALGPSRANPYTGQIYDADIIFDDSWIRFPIETNAVFGAKGIASATSDNKLRAFLEAHPSFDIVPLRHRQVPNYGDTSHRHAPVDSSQLPKRFHEYTCDYGADLRNELSFASTVLTAQGYGEFPEEFVYQIVKEVVMHEVGHTLGLRHNFKASTWLPLEDVLGQPDAVRPLGGSVMDYNAFMFHPEKENQGDFAMRTIGPYDDWAIMYGYHPVSEPYKSEDELLKAITDRVAEAGLDYATDEDTGLFEPDPLVNRRDMGADPLEYARYRIALAKKLFANMDEWAVEDGQSYSRLRARFNRLMAEIGNSATYAGRFIGGQYFHRDHKGDPNARSPFVMVSAAKQREAMTFLADNVFSPNAFSFDPALLKKLAPGRWRHWGSDDYATWIEYNFHDRVESTLRWALLPLFNPFTITRLHDMEAMYDKNEEAYTLAEHIQTLTQAIWSELDQQPKAQGKDVFIVTSRRALQRAYTEQLADYVLGSPGYLTPADAYALMRMTCRNLKDKIAKTVGNQNLDDISLAHLQDVHERLEKALAARFEQR